MSTEVGVRRPNYLQTAIPRAQTKIHILEIPDEVLLVEAAQFSKYLPSDGEAIG